MTHQPWTCPRCSRIWAPTTKGCEACNAAVEIAAIHGFRIEGAEDATECPQEGLGSPERRLSVVSGKAPQKRPRRAQSTLKGSNEALSQNAAEYLDLVQALLRGQDNLP